jgi:hypothetical protein
MVVVHRKTPLANDSAFGRNIVFLLQESTPPRNRIAGTGMQAGVWPLIIQYIRKKSKKAAILRQEV